MTRATPRPRSKRRRARSPKEHARRLTAALRVPKVLALRLKGLSLRQVAEQLAVSHEQVRLDEQVALSELADEQKTQATRLRAIEGQRLDQAQAAIWSRVLKGELEATKTFLRLSTNRAALYGLNAPTRITVTPETRPYHELADDELQRELEASVAALSASGLLPASIH